MYPFQNAGNDAYYTMHVFTSQKGAFKTMHMQPVQEAEGESLPMVILDAGRGNGTTEGDRESEAMVLDNGPHINEE